MRAVVASIIFFLLSIRGFAFTDDSLPKSTSSRFLIFPFIIRSPETNWGFGGAAAFFFKAGRDKEELRTSDINLLSLYTTRKQTVVVLGSTIFFPGEKQVFRFQGSYSYYPDKFWGIGNRSPEAAKESYSLKQYFFNPQFLIKFYKKLFAGISVEGQRITNFTYEKGGIFDTQNISGRKGGFTSGVGVLFTFDTRNNAYSPNAGAFFEINATRFDEKIGSDFNFTSYLFDWRKFISMGRNTVIGFQSVARLNDGNVPLRNLSMLGGTEMMRGYYKGRFTDKNLVAFQSEIRRYLFWRIGIVAFASAGQVGGKVKELRLDDFHYAFGTGLRIVMHEKEKVNLRVDIGFGNESNGIYVILKEAF